MKVQNLRFFVSDLKVVRSGQKLSKKSADGEKKSGWFSGFWGRKESKKKDDEEDTSVPESKSQSVQQPRDPRGPGCKGRSMKAGTKRPN